MGDTVIQKMEFLLYFALTFEGYVLVEQRTTCAEKLRYFKVLWVKL